MIGLLLFFLARFRLRISQDTSAKTKINATPPVAPHAMSFVSAVVLEEGAVLGVGDGDAELAT